MAQQTASHSSSTSSSNNETIKSQNNESDEEIFQFSPEIAQNQFSSSARPVERFPILRPPQRLLPQNSTYQDGDPFNFPSLELVLSNSNSSQSLSGQPLSSIGLGISQIPQEHSNEQSQCERERPDIEQFSEQTPEASEQQPFNVEQRPRQNPLTSRLYPFSLQQESERAGSNFGEETSNDSHHAHPPSTSISSHYSLDLHPPPFHLKQRGDKISSGAGPSTSISGTTKARGDEDADRGGSLANAIAVGGEGGGGGNLLEGLLADSSSDDDGDDDREGDYPLEARRVCEDRREIDD
ncbi:hypothetical protein ACMFMG_011616 [Clarireedia jacksonii]